MRAQGVQSSNKSNLGTVVGFEQSSQHFSSKNYRTNQKKKINLSPCAVATNDFSNSNNKDWTMNFSGLLFFFFQLYTFLPLLVDSYMCEGICMFYFGVHCGIASEKK